MNVKIVGEGSEELGDGGLDDFVPRHPELLQADVIIVCDAGNLAVGVPSLTTTLRGVVEVVVTVRTLSSRDALRRVRWRRPGRPRRPHPHAVDVARRAGQHDDPRARQHPDLERCRYPPEQFRKDANVLDGVDLLGGDIADMIWARPAVTVLGIDCPAIAGCTAAIQPEARALISLRIPPGVEARAPRTR